MLKYALLAVFFVILIVGCVAPSVGTGTLQLKITDKVDNVTSLILNISEVKVHIANETVAESNATSEGSETNETDTLRWIIVTGPKSIDLISVKDVKEILGETNLSAGMYTQIRLEISSASAIINGVQHDLFVPSKAVKLIHPFTIEANKTTSLILDWDADNAIVEAGSKWILKPVVRVQTEFSGKDNTEAEAIKTQQRNEAVQKRAEHKPEELPTSNLTAAVT